MTRRHFVIALGASVLAAPRRSIAQPAPAVRRIGFLTPRWSPNPHDHAFAQGLRALGYVEKQNLVIERRSATGQYDRLAGLATELARMNLAVIVASGTPATRAAHAATTSVPIVAVAAVDLVGSGLAKNLARPGGNVTGLAVLNGDGSRKQLDLLRTAIPKLSRVAVLLNPGNSANGAAWKSVQAAGRALQVEVLAVLARTPEDLERGFAAMVRDEVGAGIVAADAFFAAQGAVIAELAAKHRIPTIGSDREYVAAGLVMSYGQNMAEFHRRAAWYVDRILKGASPATLPVEEPTKIELAINRKAAGTVGLTLPHELLQRADEVIE